MGSALSTATRREFVLQSSPMMQLVASDHTEEIRRDLREAMKALKGKPAKRSPFNRWLRDESYNNQRDTVGISKVLLEQCANKGSEQRDLLLAGMTWLKTQIVYQKERKLYLKYTFLHLRHKRKPCN